MQAPPGIAVAVDAVVLAVRREPPDAASLRFLATSRTRAPHAGLWQLPGSQIGPAADLEIAARAALAAAGVAAVRHLEQLATFGDPGRDPRGRVVSVSYLGLLSRPVAVAAGSAWQPALQPPTLAFDHVEILASAVERLRGKLSYSTVAYGLLEEEFTLSDLQEVYEAVLGRPVDKRNFRKKVLSLGMLTEAEGQRRGPHRPAQLYRFARPRLELLDAVISV